MTADDAIAEIRSALTRLRELRVRWAGTPVSEGAQSGIIVTPVPEPPPRPTAPRRACLRRGTFERLGRVRIAEGGERPASACGGGWLNTAAGHSRHARTTASPLVAVIVEVPDPDWRRWHRAFEILLEAGRARPPEADPLE